MAGATGHSGKSLAGATEQSHSMEPPRRSSDDWSRRWLQKFDVDSGACTVFLALRPDQQETLRRMGGLRKNRASAVLMKRIRQLFGYADFATLMASDDLDKRSRSPELRIPSTQMEDVQHFKGSGKGSLRDAIPLPQPLHDRTGSLGAAEHTQTGVTAAEPAAAVHLSNLIERSRAGEKCLSKTSARGFETTTERLQKHGRETSRSCASE